MYVYNRQVKHVWIKMKLQVSSYKSFVVFESDSGSWVESQSQDIPIRITMTFWPYTTKDILYGENVLCNKPKSNFECSSVDFVDNWIQELDDNLLDGLTKSTKCASCFDKSDYNEITHHRYYIGSQLSASWVWGLGTDSCCPGHTGRGWVSLFLWAKEIKFNPMTRQNNIKSLLSNVWLEYIWNIGR